MYYEMTGINVTTRGHLLLFKTHSLTQTVKLNYLIVIDPRQGQEQPNEKADELFKDSNLQTNVLLWKQYLKSRNNISTKVNNMFSFSLVRTQTTIIFNICKR